MNVWSLRLSCCAALLIMFFLEYFDMLSGGALGSLTVGLATCYTWEHGKPAKLSQGANQNYSAAVERVMAVVGGLVGCVDACSCSNSRRRVSRVHHARQ
jgi:hypothetical protein